MIERAHRHHLPVLVDAAGELPPRGHLKSIPATGADLVCFSGGKSIRGPQATGILCGRKELVGAAAVQMLDMDDHLELWNPPAELIDKNLLDGIPRHGIGRHMKVSKDEIVALLTALDLFTSGAYDDELEKFRSCLQRIANELADEPVTCRLVEKGDGESLPQLEITVDEATVGRTAFEICASLRAGKPPIYMGHGRLAEGQLMVHPLCLKPDDADVIATRLREELGR